MMTAPRPLPPCPVCGNPPGTFTPAPGAAYAPRFYRFCERATDTTAHSVETIGRTQAEADARWRRLAGGEK